jgi:hypothetical protein
MGSFTLHRCTHHFIFVSERTTHPTHGLPHPTQGHTTFHLRLREEPHTHLMGTPNSWASSPHTGAHNVPSPSQRGTTHPSHGLSLRPTHSDCVLEDVSRSYNHQHSLSAREAFSTRPSLSQKYSNFVLASSLVKISAICSWVGRYCTCTVFLCTMSLIYDILSQCVSIYHETQGSQRASHSSGYHNG